MKKILNILSICLFIIFLSACKKDVNNVDEVINSPIPLIQNISSGALSDGSVIEINGVSFGEKNIVGPLVFENFDSNDAGRQDGNSLRGENCSHHSSWRDSEWDHAPTYESDNNRIGSTLSGYYPLVANNTALNHSNGWIDFAESHQPTILISIWIRYTYDSYDASSGNVKMYRMTDGTGDSDDHTSLQVGSGNNDPGRGFFSLWAGDNFKPWPIESDNTLNFDYTNDGIWENHIIMFKASDNNTSNGSAIIWIDGEKLEDTNAMETWGTGDSWQSFTIGHYVANYKAGNFHIYADDIYIDNTWQSVWIGDKPTWDDCTHREIQIPTVWSDNSITIKFNKGSFQTGDTAYLFVIDEAGNVSEGFEIIIGE